MEEKYGCVLLTGGRGRRMGGVDKSALIYEGETFGARIGQQLEMLGYPCYRSEAFRDSFPENGGKGKWTVLRDIVTDREGGFIGPMGGIWSCFQQIGAQRLFFVSCDMPLFRREMALLLLEAAGEEEDWDALLWRTRDGRIHPVCGWYSISCLSVLEKALQKGNYRMMDFLSGLNCRIMDTSRAHIPDSWFANVNHPEVYAKLKEKSCAVLAVSGRKNTGKTWLLEKIVEELSGRGIRTAVIKHDGHDFEPDTPGTDSYRMKKAGAYGTAVYSAFRFSLVKDTPGMTAEDLISCFPEADLILLEGQKNSSYPKIEVLRREISGEPVCDPSTVLAYVKNWKSEEEVTKQPSRSGTAVLQLSFEDVDAILELVISRIDQAQTKHRISAT